MNKQLKTRKGTVVGRGIEWCDYTWNFLGGCEHRCEWDMPNGQRARCYAKDVALGVAREHFPMGFEHHYTHPDRLDDPFRLKEPSRIFVDSMSDMFGRWVPNADIDLMCDAIEAASWHTFLSLTKNAPRLLKMARFPKNLQVGVSSPPDHMWGHVLSPDGKAKMLRKSLYILQQLRARGVLTWLSAEPLSWDIAPILADYPDALQWIVIGAASDGARKFMPSTGALENLLGECDAQMIPVFFKGNLAGHPAATPWREFLPGYVPTAWNTAPSPMQLHPVEGALHVY